MKNDKFTKSRMNFYAEQIALYCDSMDTCKDCTFRDHEKLCCGLTGTKNQEYAPYTWDFE